jgi:AraC family transcriptional regulator, transcriptional activator of pobA
MISKKIIPVYDFFKKLDTGLHFKFTKLEESYSSYDASSPHRHNYYEVLFFIKSGGIHEIDFNTYSIEKNSLHFVSPEQVHLLRREKQVTGYVMSFSKEFIYMDNESASLMESLPFFDNPFAMPLVKIEMPSLRKELYELLEKIQKEFASNNEERASMLRLYLCILLLNAKRIHISENKSGRLIATITEITRNFKKLVQSNFKAKKSVIDYAKMLNITAGHLNDTVQKDTGKSAGAVIHDRIILEAKRLLYHSPKTVKEIAFELNYEDPS